MGNTNGCICLEEHAEIGCQPVIGRVITTGSECNDEGEEITKLISLWQGSVNEPSRSVNGPSVNGPSHPSKKGMKKFDEEEEAPDIIGVGIVEEIYTPLVEGIQKRLGLPVESGETSGSEKSSTSESATRR